MWKDIDGFNGYYQVSDDGLVRSVDRTIIDKNGVAFRKRGKIMKQSIGRVRGDDGYFVVNLHNHGKSYVIPVHRLVAMAFLENPQQLPTVNHIDGNKRNNSVENLEWASFSENNSHALIHHLREPKRNDVVQKDMNGEIVETYRSVTDAARQTGISRGMISHCIHGRAQTAGGFVWEKVRKV